MSLQTLRKASPDASPGEDGTRPEHLVVEVGKAQGESAEEGQGFFLCRDLGKGGSYTPQNAYLHSAHNSKPQLLVSVQACRAQRRRILRLFVGVQGLEFRATPTIRPEF